MADFFLVNSVSGKALKGYIGTTQFVGIAASDIEETGDELDATDSNSAPYVVTDPGCRGIRLRIEMHYRLDDDIPGDLAFGTLLSNVQIYPHGINAVAGTGPTAADIEAWRLPAAVTLGNATRVEIRGKVVVTVNIASRGVYYPPGVATPA